MKGNLQAAEQAFRQAVEVDPKSVNAQLALGQFLPPDQAAKPRPRRR